MITLNTQTKRAIKGIGIAVLIALLLQCCKGGALTGYVIRGLGGYTHQDVKETIKETIDTISIKTDTVFWEGTAIKTEVENILEPSVVKGKENFSSIFKGKKQPKLSEKDSIYQYIQLISDTLIEGNITTIISIKNAKILSQSLEYKPKFPIFINKEIIVERLVEKTIEKTITNPPRTRFGLGVTGTNNAEVGGLLILQTKNRWQYQGGYLLGMNKALNNDYKQGTISLSLIKIF